MTAALITGLLLGVGGLGYTTVLGFLVSAPTEVGRHAAFGIFFTLITLLVYSMTMFYLIGKGKAIREALSEAGLPDAPYRSVAQARKPVFSSASLAMGLTMLAAILGGGVDTDVLPVGVHSVAAVAMLGANIFAFRTALAALMVASEVVTEVNESLMASQRDG